MAVELAPIEHTDVPSVALFLHENLNRRVPVSDWVRAMVVPWKVDAPNHGFLLRSADRIVGAYLAYYSDRVIDGRTERFCNLGAWCVMEDYRAQGLGLLRALLRQPRYHFTDFSPSGNVVALNRKLNMTDLDVTTVVVPNLPWLGDRRITFTDDSATLEKLLPEPMLQIYRDHRNTAAAHHLMLISDKESCYVVFRRDTRKRVRGFASILYVSNQDFFVRSLRHVCNHLLMRHGIVVSLMERRVVGELPKGAGHTMTARPKMFKSNTLSAEQIDYFYSELTCLAW